MQWLKAFHLVFVVTWFAGLFYLPRLLLYHATAADAVGRERFRVMERRLFAIMTIGATLAVLFGILMLVKQPGFLALTWMRVKLVLVAFLVAYHLWCYALMGQVESRPRSPRWYRWFNEVPAVFLLAVVILAVVKPAFA